MFGDNTTDKLLAELEEKKKKKEFYSFAEIFISLTEILHFPLSSRNAPHTRLIKT